MQRIFFLGAILVIGCSQGRPGEVRERAIAEAFLDGIRHGKAEEVWKDTSPEFKSFMGKDQFRSFVWANPVLKEKVQFEKATSVEGSNWVECGFSAKGKKVLITLGPEAGGWQVLGLKVE